MWTACEVGLKRSAKRPRLGGVVHRGERAVTNFRVFPGGDDLNRSDFTNLRARSDICDQRRRASNDAAIPISVAAINQQTIPKPITIITTATRRPPTPHAPLLGIANFGTELRNRDRRCAL